MLGINIVFAGFALTLNGLSYIKEFDSRARGLANAFVGTIIGLNAIFQVANASCYVGFGISASMWLFAVNYFLIAAHVLLKADNWKVYGLYSLFASVASFVFAGEALVAGLWIMFYLWCMWGGLWAQHFIAISLDNKKVDKYTPHILILNGITSTFVPGLLILLGII